MKRLEEIIDIYLKMDTNYSLMITGEWGVGKTYFFKNSLAKKIIDTPVYGNETKKYKPILVSLFGLKSIEEVQTEIFISLYPLLKNKAVKLSAGIGKSIIKGIMFLKNWGTVDDYIGEVEIDKGDWIKFEEIVLCFDDLERKSKSLNIEELIGYINSLVENENAKVLIIANEGKIEESNYNSLKEKVVGITIEFIPVLEETYDKIIEKKFSGFALYEKFLKENRDFILKNFQKKSNNLRILIFALNYFQNIFSDIEKNMFNEESLKEVKEQILLNLIKFTLCISIEYQSGNIGYQNKQRD